MNLNIEAERARKQLTMVDAAKELGICAKTYSNYVNGCVPIPSDVLIRMARLFQCSADYLLGIDEMQYRTRTRTTRN